MHVFFSIDTYCVTVLCSVTSLINYPTEKMTKNSFYDFVHATDLKAVESSFKACKSDSPHTVSRP